MATRVGEPAAEPRETLPPRALPGAAALEQVAGMMLLLWQTLVAAACPPYTWKADFVEETWLILRRCLLPVMISTTFFALGAPGLQGGNIVDIFGTVDRLGAFFMATTLREFAPWINGMVIAGVAGTAICADLGARKVRDEIDALSVMGLDPIKALVVPRFLALGVVTALMNLVAIVMGIVGGFLAAVVVFQETTAGYLSTFTSNLSMPELLGSVAKTSVFGFIVGIVVCFKGLHVQGGPQGVGRAVNQAVVIAFVAIWSFNSVFTQILLAAYPETGNLH